MSRLFIGCSAAKFARVKATTDYWGRCIDQPILISGNIPCTARGKERGTSGTISGNCTFRVSGAEPVLSDAGQTRMPPCWCMSDRVTHGLRCGAQAK
jgi:hypothetical protein